MTAEPLTVAAAIAQALLDVRATAPMHDSNFLANEICHIIGLDPDMTHDQMRIKLAPRATDLQPAVGLQIHADEHGVGHRYRNRIEAGGRAAIDAANELAAGGKPRGFWWGVTNVPEPEPIDPSNLEDVGRAYVDGFRAGRASV